MSNKKTPGAFKPEPINVNAYMLSAWLSMMNDTGLVTFIKFAPGITNRPINGFPPGFCEEIMEKNVLVSDLVAKRIKLKRRTSFVIYEDTGYATTTLNVTLGRGAKRCVVDFQTGYLYLDIGIKGKPYTNVEIPVECVIDVYARDNLEISTHALGWPVCGREFNLVNINSDRELETEKFGRAEVKEARPTLTVIRNEEEEETSQSNNDSTTGTMEASNSSHVPKPNPDVAPNSSVIDMFSARARRKTQDK